MWEGDRLLAVASPGADVLGVLALAAHPSTLEYRLQRIRKISGHDLADPATRFNLQFATRAWQTLQGFRA
jgi:hypothetical protein